MAYSRHTVGITLSEADAISKLKKLLGSNCKIEKIQPPVMASDAEVNIVTVTLLCPDGKSIVQGGNQLEILGA